MTHPTELMERLTAAAPEIVFVWSWPAEEVFRLYGGDAMWAQVLNHTKYKVVRDEPSHVEFSADQLQELCFHILGRGKRFAIVAVSSPPVLQESAA